jgi:hypothetical protein
MSPDFEKVLDAYTKCNGNKTHAAKSLGMTRTNYRRLYKKAVAWSGADPIIKEAAKAGGIEDISVLGNFWKIAKDEDGNGYSLHVKNPDTGEDINFLDTVKDAFSDIPARRKITAPRKSDNGLCTFYNIVDHHLAMHSWGLETGEDYDLQIGIDRLTNCMANLIDSTPKSETAVVLNMGDFFHMDDTNNQTPQSKHSLDVDGRYYKVISAGVLLTTACIDMAASKHSKVVYRALRGNHDIHAHVALTVALKHHYRNCDHVEIQADPSDFFAFEWGKNFICAHHGDKAKADRLVLHMADKWPEIWGRTHWRFMWTGHIHHDSSKDIGGVLWESFRTLSPKDAYAASHAYSARQAMQAITMDKDFGEIMRNKVQIIPPRFC